MSFRTVKRTPPRTGDSDYVAKTGTLTFAPARRRKNDHDRSQRRQQEASPMSVLLDHVRTNSSNRVTKNRGHRHDSEGRLNAATVDRRTASRRREVNVRHRTRGSRPDKFCVRRTFVCESGRGTKRWQGYNRRERTEVTRFSVGSNRRWTIAAEQLLPMVDNEWNPRGGDDCRQTKGQAKHCRPRPWSRSLTRRLEPLEPPRPDADKAREDALLRRFCRTRCGPERRNAGTSAAAPPTASGRWAGPGCSANMK